jgi:HEAT repeat protein
MEQLRAVDEPTQVTALRAFRRLLSAERAPPVQECINCGAIPAFVECLQRVDSTDLQFEAAWALTNIASTDRTDVVVDCGAIPHLVQLLDSVSPDVREQAAWCLGNVAGDGPSYRDLVLSFDAMELLLKNISQPATISLLRNATWTLSNFCRGKPSPTIDVLAPALPALAYLISDQIEDSETRIDAAWALSYICDSDNDHIEQVIAQPDLVKSLLRMCASGANTQIMPALRTLGNIVSGTDVQTQAVLDGGLMQLAPNLLQNSKKSVRKETCWAVSNVAAGTTRQLDFLMEHMDVLKLVLEQMSSGAEWDVRKEAVWVISNISTAAKNAHLLTLLQLGVITPICDVLTVDDAKVVMCALEALEVFLKLNDTRADLDLLAAVSDCGGVDALENLQEHANTDVYEKAVELIEMYFGGEEEELLENVAPQVAANSNTFSFGMNSATTPTGNSKLDFGSDFTQTPTNAFQAQSNSSGFSFGM